MLTSAQDGVWINVSSTHFPRRIAELSLSCLDLEVCGFLRYLENPAHQTPEVLEPILMRVLDALYFQYAVVLLFGVSQTHYALRVWFSHASLPPCDDGVMIPDITPQVSRASLQRAYACLPRSE